MMEENLSKERNTGKVQNKNKSSSTDISCQGFTNLVTPFSLLPWMISDCLGSTESTFQLLSTLGIVEPNAAKGFVVIFVLLLTDFSFKTLAFFFF